MRLRLLPLPLLVLACGGTKPAAKSWQTLVEDSDCDDEDLGASVLSVGGVANDLYFAGGTLGVEPRSALALHFDGRSWTRLPIDGDHGVPQTMWWTTVTPEGTVFLAGEEGVVVRWKDGQATTYSTGVDATLFGIWGTSDEDVWAVGGAVAVGDKDVVLKFDGTAWAPMDPAPPAHGVALFKVWGAAADDVWVVGGLGVILHWDGSAWTDTVLRIPIDPKDPIGNTFSPQLFTVHGRASDDVWAVGASSTIEHWDGAGWNLFAASPDDPIYAGLINGVFAAPGGDVLAVGLGGVKVRIHGDGSYGQETTVGTASDLHGVWQDEAGNAFAVGGNFFDTPEVAVRREGTIAWFGGDVPTEGLPASNPPCR